METFSHIPVQIKTHTHIHSQRKKKKNTTTTKRKTVALQWRKKLSTAARCCYVLAANQPAAPPKTKATRPCAAVHGAIIIPSHWRSAKRPPAHRLEHAFSLFRSVVALWPVPVWTLERPANARLCTHGMCAHWTRSLDGWMQQSIAVSRRWCGRI